LVKQALRIADKVLILVGSSHAARTPKNPFTFEERRSMIFDSLEIKIPELPSTRVSVEPIRDYFYSDDLWLAQVQSVTSNYIEDGETVALLGGYKDSSSYYLNMFPQWEYVAPDRIGRTDATSIREALFDVEFTLGWGDKEQVPRFDEDAANKQTNFFEINTPKPVTEFLTNFRRTEIFAGLAQEYKANRDYRHSWGGSPFPPVFVTADAVVTCSGHVLVVKRGGNPGKGLLALPGGFIRSNERIKDAAVRELKEETRIKVDKLILKSNIVDSEVFDYPARSERGRTVTHAFHIKLRDGKLPEVKGSDDATGAFWLSLADVFKREEEFFEDHLTIIQKMIGGGLYG
jgi:bifunctional NMN adenylyltransferase/nudix hydrolase